jgi:hypothetical protein
LIFKFLEFKFFLFDEISPLKSINFFQHYDIEILANCLKKIAKVVEFIVQKHISPKFSNIFGQPKQPNFFNKKKTPLLIAYICLH